LEENRSATDKKSFFIVDDISHLLKLHWTLFDITLNNIRLNLLILRIFKSLLRLDYLKIYILLIEALKKTIDENKI